MINTTMHFDFCFLGSLLPTWCMKHPTRPQLVILSFMGVATLNKIVFLHLFILQLLMLTDNISKLDIFSLIEILLAYY